MPEQLLPRDQLNPLNAWRIEMRKAALITLASLMAATALPAHATLADRKSDQPSTEEAHPAPYSGQVVIRGEIQDRNANHENAEPAPYSGQVVIRGEVRSESHG